MSPHRFRNACLILLHFDRDQLEAAGIVRRNPHGDDLWALYQARPIHFLAKLDEERLDALWALIEAQQPEGLQ